jgi:hypothetical protein
LNHIDGGYQLPFFLMKGVGPQIQNDAARASEMAMLLDNNFPRILQGQIPHVDTILNVEDFEIET